MPQFYFHDVDSNQAAISSPSPQKGLNKKDDDLSYFDNFVLGGTVRVGEKMTKSNKHPNEMLHYQDPNKLEYDDAIVKSKTLMLKKTTDLIEVEKPKIEDYIIKGYLKQQKLTIV